MDIPFFRKHRTILKNLKSYHYTIYDLLNSWLKCHPATLLLAEMFSSVASTQNTGETSSISLKLT